MIASQPNFWRPTWVWGWLTTGFEIGKGFFGLDFGGRIVLVSLLARFQSGIRVILV
jgi:hypothetical protein